MKGCGYCCTSRLGVFPLAIALGVLSAICMALFAWSAYWSGHGIPMIAQWGEIYSGYAATMKGGWIGAAWGFLEGFISGLIIAVVYNLCSCCCRSMCRCSKGEEMEVKVTKTKKM